MPPRSKSNVPQSVVLRWNITKAATEFGVSKDTLKKSLNQISAPADSDGLYSTQQICEALFGAMHQEKLRTQRQITERITLENQITHAQVLNRAELAKGFAQVADAMASRIMVSELSRSAKEDLLKDLSSIPLMLKEVAHAQSRLPRRNGNGTHAAEVATAG
jgi:hypothetical protein